MWTWRDHFGRTPLHYDAGYGHFDFKYFKKLAEHVSDINAVDRQGNNPLHYLIGVLENRTIPTEILQAFIEFFFQNAKGNPNRENRFGETPLRKARRLGQYEAFKCIAMNIDPKELEAFKCSKGKSALTWALEKKDKDFIKYIRSMIIDRLIRVTLTNNEERILIN